MIEFKQEEFAIDSRAYPLVRPRFTRNQLNNIAYKPREKFGVFNYEYPMNNGAGHLINSKATILEIIAHNDLISRKSSNHTATVEVFKPRRDKSDSKIP